MGSAATAKGRKSNRRRDEILAEATIIFAAKGFGAASMREVAKRAGILPGSLYHHFDSKEEMLHELMRKQIARMENSYAETIARGDDPSTTLKNLIEVGLREGFGSTGILKIMIQEWKFLAQNPDFQYVIDGTEKIFQSWKAIYVDGVKQKQFSGDMNTDLLVMLLMQHIYSTVGGFVPNEPFTIDEFVETQTRMIFHGLEVRK